MNRRMRTRRQETGQSWIEQARLFFTEWIWRKDTEDMALPLRIAVGLLRVLVLAAYGIQRNRSTFTAAGLAYITILSLVPFLAFAFALAKGIGAYARLHDEVIVPFLDTNLGVLDATTPESLRSLREAINGILELVSSTDVSSLGIFGLLIVVLAVIRSLSSAEHSFNQIFGVPRPRSWVRRVADYVSLTVVTPLLMVLAVTLNAAARNSEIVNYMATLPALGWLVENLFAVTPILSVWVGFTLLYLVLPNTSVPVLPAMAGGLVGSGLWQLAQFGHVQFQVGIANYNAIYSSFAALPIFLVWIYFSWLTVMFGAEFAYALSHAKRYRQILLHDLDSIRSREILALRAVAHIVRYWSTPAGETDGESEVKDRGLTTRELADRLEVPSGPLSMVLAPLVEAGILAQGGSESRSTWLPARQPEKSTVADVLDVSRGEGPDVTLDHKLDVEVTKLYDAMRDREKKDPGNLTLAELAGLAD